MRYTKIRYTWGPSEEDTVTLPLDPTVMASPYFVKSIEGLDPPQVNLSKAKKPGGGSVRQNKRAEDRQIVAMLGYQPMYSLGVDIGDLRRALYPMMAPKMGGDVLFELMDDAETDVLHTSGDVTSIKPNIFSKDPELQLILDCSGAFLERDRYIHPNPDCYDASPLIDIRNEGSAPTGFGITVLLTAATSFFRFYTADQKNWIHITYPFLTNDVIKINTHEGERSMTLTRAGITSNLLKNLSPNTSWLQLDGGYNRLIPNVVTYKITELWFTPKYWGI